MSGENVVRLELPPHGCRCTKDCAFPCFQRVGIAPACEKCGCVEFARISVEGRPVQVDFSLREAAATAAALDLAAHILDCCDDDTDGLNGDELRGLQRRLLHGVAVAEAERALGHG